MTSVMLCAASYAVIRINLTSYQKAELSKVDARDATIAWVRFTHASIYTKHPGVIWDGCVDCVGRCDSVLVKWATALC